MWTARVEGSLPRGPLLGAAAEAEAGGLPDATAELLGPAALVRAADVVVAALVGAAAAAVGAGSEVGTALDPLPLLHPVSASAADSSTAAGATRVDDLPRRTTGTKLLKQRYGSGYGTHSRG